MCHGISRKKARLRRQFRRDLSSDFQSLSTVSQHVWSNGRRYNPVEVGCTVQFRGCAMTSDDSVALSFASTAELPRVGLGDRLRADDPHLLELAQSLSSRAQAVRAK